MKLKAFLLVSICAFPLIASGAERERGGEVRIGVNRVSQAALRAPTNVKRAASDSSVDGATTTATITATVEPVSTSGCRDSYRTCMDQFCLLDESEGARCACSDNIEQSKSLIIEIQKIQSDAEKLYTTGVEQEKLDTRTRRLLFGESENAKKSSLASGLSFSEWLNSGVDENGEMLGSDEQIGGNLYQMAEKFCASKLSACGTDSEMEQSLYSRLIVQDCKNFNSYLSEQKSAATGNKASAEKAVRAARLTMLDTTNKYNRGECFLAYKSCISDKGGCGENFENCLDKDLLTRRANACEDVLDQCTAVKSYVLQDWDAESESVLSEAAKYADQNRRSTCFAKIQGCLETGCSTGTNSACLTDVNVAAGICPVINECEQIIPGIKDSVNDKLGYLRLQFCQNDIDKCLQDKCGKNYDAPECLGKDSDYIVKMCPQSMFPSCSGETQFKLILQAALLQMDYQKMQGCVNYFGEALGKVCGTDMSCLPTDDTVATLTVIPEDLTILRETVRANSKSAVNTFFKQFEKDVTVSACKDAKKPSGKSKLGDTIFKSAKLVAEISAENRALRALETKIAELSRAADLETAEKNCLKTYAVESPDKSSKNYSYIKSVSFEPSLRNCHVCRMQQVCEIGGEDKNITGLKTAASGMALGASAGTSIMPGWGTAIGGVVGAVGGFFGGKATAVGEKPFCQELESCEDVNM